MSQYFYSVIYLILNIGGGGSAPSKQWGQIGPRRGGLFRFGTWRKVVTGTDVAINAGALLGGWGPSEAGPMTLFIT